MREASAGGGSHRRDFLDVIWQIAERRACDDIVIRYECGHNLRADVWVPALPRVQDYGATEPERQRFMQHCLFILTQNAGATRVQITVPESRCRLCGRGQRQTLVCGLFHVDVGDSSGRGGSNNNNKGPANLRKLELPLSSHMFLASMGQVCRLPVHIAPPMLATGSSGCVRPFDGPALPREVRQWKRKDIEAHMQVQVLHYISVAAIVLVILLSEFVWLFVVHLSIPTSDAAGASSSTSLAEGSSYSDELRTMKTVNSFELFFADLTWTLSRLTVVFHKAFAPAAGETSSILWTVAVHPLWACSMLFTCPVLFVVELTAALPRLFFLNACLPVLRGAVLQPTCWLMGNVARLATSFVTTFVHGILVESVLALCQMPVRTPMLVAVCLCLVVALISAPHCLSFTLPSVWTDMPQFEFDFKKVIAQSRSMAVLQRWRALWASRKEGRSRGGGGGAQRVAQTTKNSRSEKHASGRDKAETVGRQEGRAHGRAPACFVCLDKPSLYLVEPCGHRVVCGECAMQLVDAAARNRVVAEAANVASVHHGCERGAGGACPSCGQTITRAMRLFA